MVEILNSLRPFFEDCYERIHVRQYAALFRIAPPTASTLLSSFFKEGLLMQEKDRRYLFYAADRESRDFVDLSRMYWRHRLLPLVAFLEHQLVSPTVILFGSLAKAEAKKDSDIDLAVIARRNALDLGRFERQLGRRIQPFWIPSLRQAKSKALASNVLNGYLLAGRSVM